MGCGCGADIVFTLTPGTPHYAREDCSACGKMIRWVPKPTPDHHSPKRKNTNLLKLFPGVNRCSLCLRSKNQLPGRNTLEVHHINEVKDGGEDSPENLWVVCSRCHKMIHQRRRDFADYHLHEEREELWK